MKVRFLNHRFWRLLGWGLVAGLLLGLMMPPCDGTFLSLDDGLAFAATGAPPRSDGPGDDDEDGPGDVPPPLSEAPSCPSLIKPTAGTPVVAATLLPSPPASIPPVGRHHSILALIPATDKGAVAQVSTELGAGHLVIAIVPTDPNRHLVLRIQELELEKLPAPLNTNTIPTLSPSAIVTDVVFVFTMDLFDAETGAEINFHTPVLLEWICFATDFAPATPLLVRFDEEVGAYHLPVQEYFPPARALRADLPETSIFVVVTIVDNASQQAFAVPEPVIPAGLPRTGDGGKIPNLLWTGLFTVFGLAAFVGFWRWQAIGR